MALDHVGCSLDYPFDLGKHRMQGLCTGEECQFEGEDSQPARCAPPCVVCLLPKMENVCEPGVNTDALTKTLFRACCEPHLLPGYEVLQVYDVVGIPTLQCSLFCQCQQVPYLRQGRPNCEPGGGSVTPRPRASYCMAELERAEMTGFRDRMLTSNPHSSVHGDKGELRLAVVIFAGLVDQMGQA